MKLSNTVHLNEMYTNAIATLSEMYLLLNH